jgi:hypothetical protein
MVWYRFHFNSHTSTTLYLLLESLYNSHNHTTDYVPIITCTFVQLIFLSFHKHEPAQGSKCNSVLKSNQQQSPWYGLVITLMPFTMDYLQSYKSNGSKLNLALEFNIMQGLTFSDWKSWLKWQQFRAEVRRSTVWTTPRWLSWVKVSVTYSVPLGKYWDKISN